MQQQIFLQKKINSINKITAEIQKTYNNDFSIIVYDEEGAIWIEKFTDTFEKAKVIAGNLFEKVLSEY